MLNERLDIELSDFPAEDSTVKGDYLWQVVEIVIVGVPTILEVLYMCFFMSRGRILLQGSVLMNLFVPMRHQVDLQNVEVSISLHANIYLVADIFQSGVHFVPLLGQRLNFSNSFVVHLSLLYLFFSQGIGFGLHLFAGLPK